LEQQTRCPVNAAEASKGKQQKVTATAETSNDRVFKLLGEPLYGGKGKCSNLNSKEGDNCVNNPTINVEGESDPSAQGNEHNRQHTGTTFEGLHQPRLEGTHAIVCGENRNVMRKENKRRHQELSAEQPMSLPWSVYEGKTPPLCPTNHNTHPTYRNSMCPSGRGLGHPAAAVLDEWAQFGCPTCTENHGKKRRCGKP